MPDPYRQPELPKIIYDDPKQRAIFKLNERFGALPVERVIVMHLASATEVTAEHVADLLGVNGPEFRGEAPPAELIAKGILMRKRKGTPWAMREVLRVLGYGEVELVEYTNAKHDGTLKHNGERKHNGANSWATFLLYFEVEEAFSVDDVRAVWDVVKAWKPTRSHFALGFREEGEPTAMYFARP